MDHKKEQQKQQAARAAADYIKEGMTIGLGSGTTSRYLIREAISCRPLCLLADRP